MISRLTHVVTDFQEFVRANFHELTDVDLLELVTFFWLQGCVNARELTELGSMFKNAETILSSAVPDLSKRFVNESFYSKPPIKSGRSMGILRRKDNINNSFLEMRVASHNLIEIQWSEEFGIVPLSEDMFICRTFQVLGQRGKDGVIPLTCMLIPTKFVWDLPGSTGSIPSFYGGHTMIFQGKITEVPPEVKDACPDVKGALVLTGLLPRTKPH